MPRASHRFAICLSIACAAGLTDPARAQLEPSTCWVVDGIPVAAAPNAQAEPAAVADGAGGAIVVWTDSRAGGFDNDIYAVRVTQTGAVAPGWPVNGIAVCNATGNQNTPKIVADGSGGAIVTWTDGRLRQGPIAHSDIYAQRITANGTIASGWPANGLGVCTQDSSQFGPEITTNGSGGAIVAWEDKRGGYAALDIYVQQVTTTGGIAPGWPTNGIPLCVAFGTQDALHMISDGAGGAIATWLDGRNGINTSDIYAQRVTGGGTIPPGWPVNGVALCTAANNQGPSAIISDGQGGAIVTWQDCRVNCDIVNGGGDIYAQRVLSDGLPGWPIRDGLAVCTVGCETPAILPDSAGGAFICWSDKRSGNRDVYIQRITGSGSVAAGWPSTGVPLCVADGNQIETCLVADGSNGAIAAWTDWRRGGPPTNGLSPDIYAQRVTSNGSIGEGWPATGFPVCVADSVQFGPVLIESGPNRIVTWTDRRSEACLPGPSCGSDVYAQCVGNFNPVGVPHISSDESTALRLFPPRPNPTHGSTVVTFMLPSARTVSIQIVDVAGRLVRTLDAHRELAAGQHTLSWDGRDNDGALVLCRVYVVVVRAGGESAARNLVLVR